MEYMDEKIIQQRLAISVEKRHTISHAVEIDGVRYTFARREFELGFSMVVPENFDTLASEYAKRKFPYEDRPEIIIASENTETCFSFNHGDLRSESLEERIQVYKSCIKRLNPSNVFFRGRIYETAEGLKVACYDYRYAALDGDIYNLSFFADLPNCELFGWLTCPICLCDKWEPLMSEMISTIQVIQDEK